MEDVETQAYDEANYLETQEVLQNLEIYFNRLISFHEYGFDYQKLNIHSILKAIGLEIINDYDNKLEMIIDYMMLQRHFVGDRLFVFNNIRLLYDDNDIADFMKSLIKNRLKIIMIESVYHEKIPFEKRITIDNDLCEF